MLMSQDRIYVAQGEFAVGETPNSVLTAILGSCVSACIWDEERRVGGINHILLAENRASNGLDFEGVNAMEVLINGLIRKGANRLALKAKVVGGARMVAGLSNIGERNANFVLSFLEDEKIPVLAKDVGGTQARQIRFYPSTAKVQIKYVSCTQVKERAPVAPTPKAAPSSHGDVELF